MTDAAGLISTLQAGAQVDVVLSSGETVPGTVGEVTRFGVLVSYTDTRGPAPRSWSHWFHPTGRRMGDHDRPAVSFIDRFGARTDLP